MTDLLERVRAEVEPFVAIRRDIHRHPELAFEESRTSDLVAGLLEGWGYQVTRGVGGHGVVGQLRRGNGLRAVGLRADMDALPITEATDAPYASANPGVMHACGHDGHTTMLLAAAKTLAERGSFNGTLNLIFQPAEEHGRADSGAARMIADGLFDKFPCDAVFGMHNMPGIPQGRLVFRQGPTMASADWATIVIRGRGGHAAIPHHAADPVVAASSLVMGLQTIVARNVDPTKTAVVTIGVFKAGTVSNVIPQTARLEMTIRALEAPVRDLLEQRIRALAAAQAESYGCTAEVTYERGYPSLVNSQAETEFARQVGADLVGADLVTPQGPPLMGAEDFAFMLEARPGNYCFIGNGDGPMVHNPGYDFNDGNIAVGAAYWTLLAERYLGEETLAA